ncbi:MAG TPA: hypothetical protein VFN08_00895 [Gemmatimonadales bacterium]|jgi:hypothetical protein|nr:hypothetical protein [Gemmatimonadales bacterium]
MPSAMLNLGKAAPQNPRQAMEAQMPKDRSADADRDTAESADSSDSSN